MLVRGVGGWANGSDYVAVLNRSGAAIFVGHFQAPRMGSYTGTAPREVVDSAFAVVSRDGALGAPRFDRCADNERLVIKLKPINGDTIFAGNGCPAPAINYAVAARLDSLFARVQWQQGS